MRLDLKTGDETLLFVTLSRRNLLSLLQKLSMPGSARTLFSANCYRDGERGEDLLLVVSVEEDEEHYSSRGFPRGLMHPATEQFLINVWDQEGGN